LNQSNMKLSSNQIILFKMKVWTIIWVIIFIFFLICFNFTVFHTIQKCERKGNEEQKKKEKDLNCLCESHTKLRVIDFFLCCFCYFVTNAIRVQKKAINLSRKTWSFNRQSSIIFYFNFEWTPVLLTINQSHSLRVWEKERKERYHSNR